MAKVQKTYTREFKEEAVRLVQTSGKSIAQVARELGISDTSIHQWRKELAQHGTGAFPGSGHQTALEEENRRRVSRTGASPTGARNSKKSSEHLLTGIQMNYQFSEQHKHTFAIVVMCQVLGVSESGLYAWPVSANEKRLSSPKQFGRSLTSIRAATGVRASTETCARRRRSLSRKRVARLMGKAELAARRKQRRVLTPKRDATHPVAPNVLHRECTATEPNTKWVTDITSIPTTQGWLSVAAILDLYSRAVVGWAMSHCCDEQLAEAALNMAVSRRRPKAGLLHHSDRGCQYTSRSYQQRLAQMAAVVSMSRKGTCWDNAARESFFGSLTRRMCGQHDLSISGTSQESAL